MGLFMQKYRNKILLFTAISGALIVLYSFLSSSSVRIYAPVRRLDSVKESTGTIFEEDRGRGVGLTPPDKLLASSGLNDSGDGAEKEKEPAPTKVEAAIRTPGGAPYDSSMIGMLNFDFWRWVTGYTVDDLRLSREFPYFPDERKTVSRLHFEFSEVDKADVRGRYGHKVYGYLLPPSPGTYSFKMHLAQMTAAVSGELWISPDTDTQGMNKILSYTYDDQSRPVRRIPTDKSQEVNNIKLNTAHYFEFLVKAYEGKVIIDVQWKGPKSRNYEDISKSCFALAYKLDDGGNPVDKVSSSPFLKGPLSSNHFQTHHRVFSLSNTIYPIKELSVLPTCEFSALYARRRRIKSYTGINQVFESKVEPKDETWFKNWRKKDKGNPSIDKGLVNKVISLYTFALNTSKEIKGDVMALRYLEETPNKGDGSRFLLEMDVQLYGEDEETVHTSEYVYLKKGSNFLCHTSNFQWTKNAEVYFIVTVRNLGHWVKHVIYNMEDIYEQTRDEHFALVLVDYGSVDMDIAAEANRSTFKRIHVLEMDGDFSRSGGLQAGIEYITDPNVIVMTIDMHLTLPPGIVEYTRRHTVQHKMAFTPMFFRLNKGYTDVNFNGFWETLTYGLFAMYKDDWTTFGGFNTKKYKSKWGGEDWDILDRALAKGYEAFRIRPPGLTHYHHTKTGMWGNTDIKLSTKFTLKYK